MSLDALDMEPDNVGTKESAVRIWCWKVRLWVTVTVERDLRKLEEMIRRGWSWTEDNKSDGWKWLKSSRSRDFAEVGYSLEPTRWTRPKWNGPARGVSGGNPVFERGSVEPNEVDLYVHVKRLSGWLLWMNTKDGWGRETEEMEKGGSTKKEETEEERGSVLYVGIRRAVAVC